MGYVGYAEVEITMNPELLLFAGLYLIMVNVLAFSIYGLDKYRARRNSRRIAERTLHLLALLGGVFGAIVAMRLFHHKTRKKAFYWVTATIMLFNIGAAGLFIYYFQ